jgi:hypothetical protein
VSVRGELRELEEDFAAQPIEARYEWLLAAAEDAVRSLREAGGVSLVAAKPERAAFVHRSESLMLLTRIVEMARKGEQ